MMNERIKELAKQSGFYFYDMHDIDGEDCGESVEADSFGAVDKFVKLIIGECCRTLYDNEMGGYQTEYCLKEHFGVKE